MVKRPRFVVLAVIAVLVFLAGCTSGGQTPSTTPFCGGIKGMEIKFIEDEPPGEVFDGSQFPFSVSVRLLNLGENAIEPQDAKIELSGISSIDFGGPSYSKFVPEKVFAVEKDQNSGACSDPSPVVVSFGTSGESQFNYRQSLPGNTPFNLRADVCYKYRTKATAQFCVQKDIPRFGQEPTCRVDETKPVSNSGAPVQVENFAERLGGQNRLSFSFDVAHKGTGVVHSGALCDTAYVNKNKVRVRVSSTAGPVSCPSLGGGSEGDVTLSENRRSLTCVLDVSGISGREFETPMNIEVSYNYKEHADTNILVKHFG